MRHSAKAMSLGMALAVTTAMVPEAIAQKPPVHGGWSTHAQQQTQAQQQTKAQQQQSTHPGNAAKGASKH